VTVEVEVDGAGAGTVTSSPAGISCPGTCLMQAAPGTVITLSSTANANSHFDGYGGAICHGTSCAFTVSAAAKIFASFSSTVVTLTHTLTVTSSGQGTVVSNPPGISCPGACSAPFQEGATLVLIATPASPWTFGGWTGACSGAGGCSLSLGSDAAVTATFFPPTPDSCTGLMTALPAQQILTGGAPGPAAGCVSATSDGDGNVYVSAIAEGAGTVAVSNHPTISDIELIVPLQTGFVGIPHEEVGPNASVAYSPDGTIVSSVPFPDDGAIRTRGLNANGGSIVVGNRCDAATGTNFTFMRFDDQNQLTSSKTVVEATCPTIGVGLLTMVDLMNDTLLVFATDSSGAFGVAGGHLATRWFDANALPLTGWFDAGAVPQSPVMFVRPLIGGGAALRAGDNWIATLPSGKASPGPAPAFFEADKDAVIARGGKAYAMIPDPGSSGSVDIAAASDGKSCGALISTRVNPIRGQGFTEFHVGKDLTLIHLGGAENCTAQYYSQALK
jgi:hypothetical protein